MYTPTTSGADDSLTESKFTVAGILSSMANGHGLSPFSDPGPSFASAVASVSTPVLTPSTLANLEQTFIELTAVQSQATTQVTDLSTTSNHLGARQSGFVPPVVDPNVLAYTDDSSSDQDWFPSPKRPRTEVNITSSAIVIAPDSAAPGRRRTPGPRRSKHEQLTPEEEQRRRLRRERNKLAAAKCRQRRVDQTNALTNETEELEEEKASLETEVESLQQVKEHLEFVLEAHRPLCNKHILKIPQEIKSEPETSPAASITTTRPTSLPLSTRSLPILHPTGVAITTPSSVITTLGLDNLVDHTGLTPLTGGPANCASEAQRGSDSSSPGEHLGSPTRLMAL